MKCSYVEKGIRLKLFSKNNELYLFSKPCCHMLHDELAPIAQQKLNMKLIDVKDIMSLPSLQYYRNYFKNNDTLPPACVKCSNIESQGLNSPRIIQNKLNYQEYDIARLDVVLSNLCNLACPFCSSHASSLIDKLSLTLDEKPENWIPLKNSHDFEQPKAQNTSEIIAEILSNHRVHTLKLLGGEPFLKENWCKISDEINNGSYTNLNINITTNGTVINNSIIKTLQKVKHVELLISIDSIGKNYDFIRWPHKWERMQRNLDILYKANLPNTNIVVSILVNIFNFELLPEIEKHFPNASYQCEIQPESSLQNFRLLPDVIINKIKSQIKSKNLKEALFPLEHNVSKNKIRREFEVLLKQRKMNASDVIGPLTRKYYEL
jgi:sulfatase maturation enzyme AslB (radical SAM superfamily)